MVRKTVEKKITLHEGDNVVLKNGKEGEVLEISGTRFCIKYEDGYTEWIAISSVVSRS